MNTIKLFYRLLLLVMLVQASACKKYLDEKSDKSLVVPSSLDDLQGMMDDYTFMNANTPDFGETSADDYFLTPASYAAVYDNDRLAYTWSLRNYKFQNEWSNCYHAIYNSNYCIEKSKAISRGLQNAAKYDNVIGSAHFFRAYYFLNLAWDFAKAYSDTTAGNDRGIVLRLGSDFNVPSTRATVAETYKQVISDLDVAATYLPDNPINLYRPSKAAAYGTLARTYLSMRIYDSAYKYAALALQIKDDLLDYNSAEVDASSPVPFQPYNREIVFYSTQGITFSPLLPFYSFADTLLYDSYSLNDLRKTVFYFPQGGYYTFKGHYSSSNYLAFSGITTSELLLVKAECEARAGLLTDAAADLDRLLQNRYVTGTYTAVVFTSSAMAIDIILKERRKELCMRGLRWMDIKRLNKEGENILLKRSIDGQEVVLPPNDNRYALPIPQDIIELTGIQQN